MGKVEENYKDLFVERKFKWIKFDDGILMFFGEVDFVIFLNKELNKLNVFFIEKEEEYVICF